MNERSFRTYHTSTATLRAGEDMNAMNARLERERAQRYIDQADSAMRLALACLRRAKHYEESKADD